MHYTGYSTPKHICVSVRLILPIEKLVVFQSGEQEQKLKKNVCAKNNIKLRLLNIASKKILEAIDSRPKFLYICAVVSVFSACKQTRLI